MRKSSSLVQKQIHDFCVQLFIERSPQMLFDYLSDDIYYFCNKIDNEIHGKQEVHKYFTDLCQVIKIYNKIELSRFRLTAAAHNFWLCNLTVCYDDEINLNCAILFKNTDQTIQIQEVHLYWNVLLSQQDKNLCPLKYEYGNPVSSDFFYGSFSVLTDDTLSIYSCDKKLLSRLQYETFSELKQHTPFLYQLLHPNYKKNSITEISACKKSKKDFFTEICLTQKNGQPLWLLAITQKNKIGADELITFSCFYYHPQKQNLLHAQNLLLGIDGGYGIFIINENKRIYPLYFSDTLFQILEKNPKDYTFPSPRLISNSIIEEDREYYIRSIQETAKDISKSLSVTFRTITPSGRIKWFKTSSYTIPCDEYKDCYYLYILYTDISDIKEDQNILKNAFDKSKAAHAVCSCDDAWTISMANEQFLALLGLSKSQLGLFCGNRFAELFTPSRRERYVEEAKNKLEQAGFFDLTAELTINNEILPVHLVGEKIFSNDNTFVLNMFQTNSEQNKLYNLIELKNEINELYQNIPAIIFHCDPNGILTFANEYFYIFTAYSQEEFNTLFGADLKKICTRQSCRNAVKTILKAIREKNTKCFFEITFITKHGSRETLLINAALQYGRHGKLEKFCCMASEKSLSEAFRQQHFIEKAKLETSYQKLSSAYWEYNIQTEECFLHYKQNGKLRHAYYKNFTKEFLEQNLLVEECIPTFTAIHSNLKKGIGCEKAELGFYDKNHNEIWFEVTYIIPKNEIGYITSYYGIAKDITELKQKRVLLDYVSRHLNINFWTYNANTKILKCINHAAHNFMYDEIEYDVPESRIQSGIVHPDDSEIYRNTYNNILNSPSSSCEIRIKNKNNEFTWVKITLSALQNSASPIYIGTAFDISEQKQIEIHYNQLVNSKTFQFKNNIVAKIMYNLTQNTVISLISSLDSVNLQLLPPASEFIREQIQYIVPGYYREQYIENFNIPAFMKKFESGERQFQYVFPIERENMLTWISNNITLFQHPEDNNIFAAVNCYDISDEISRKVFSENYFNQQLDFLVQIDTITDSYKFFPATITIEEYASYNLTGKFSHDFGNILRQTLVGEDNENLLEEVKNGKIFAKLKNNEKYDIIVKTYRSNRKDNLRYKQFHFYQYSFIPYIVCFACSDVTEHYSKEQQKNEMLKQALEAANAANRTKNSFLASMSHDLRTPMNAIIGMTKLALEEEDNSKKTVEYLNIINESSSHLLGIINDVLEMNKLENGEMEFHTEPFSIIEEFNKIIDLFKVSFKEKKLTFTYDKSKIIHPHVEGDKTKLNRIITNLLSNAQKYTPSGGKISMTITEQHQQNKNLSIFTVTISDTGIGIAPENLHTIFDPFKREEDRKVQKIEGIGLGLSIVKMLTEKQGGSISVTSKKNEGSAFTVTIPYPTLKTTSQQHKTAEIPQNADLSHISILIAEDNMINVLVLQKLLEKLKAKLTVAHNGQEALDIYSQNPHFDIILMDMQMPVLTGTEATKRIRNLPIPQAKTVPIIAVTANAFKEDIKQCLKAGMNEHISKPIKFEELYALLELYTLKKS